MAHLFADIENLINASISCVLHNKLERSKELSEEQLSVFLVIEVFDRHLDSSRFVSSVLRRNGVACERLSSPEQFGARKSEDSIQVLFESFVRDGESGPDSQVFQVPPLCLGLDVFQQICFRPVFCHKQN